MTEFSFDLLRGLVNEKFDICLPESGEKIADLTVSQVNRYDKNAEFFDEFTIELTGDPDEHCAQGNYLFKHKAFGEELLFLMPYSEDKYQICISQKKAESTE